MDQKRFPLLIAIFIALMLIYTIVTIKFFPPKPVNKPVAQADGDKAQDDLSKDNGDHDKTKADKTKSDGDTAKPDAAKPDAAKPDDAKPDDAANPPAAENTEPEPPLQRVMLGTVSANDPQRPYRMLVTFTNRGAAIERVEFSDPKYREIDDRSGYLGTLATTDMPEGGGVKVNLIGDGAPALAAGLQVDDVITEITPEKSEPIAIADSISLRDQLKQHTEPDQTLQLNVIRGGKSKTLAVKLTRKPLSVIWPEEPTNPSLLLTLPQIAGKKLAAGQTELAGLNLRGGNWQVDPDLGADHVTFRYKLPKWKLEIEKRFELAKVADPNIRYSRDYHLQVKIRIINLADQATNVAYQLEGPNGLPTEGHWYARRIEHDSGPGLRDVSFRFNGQDASGFSATTIVDKKASLPANLGDATLDYMGVTGQYFAAILLPETDLPLHGLNSVQPITVGTPLSDTYAKKLSNISCQLNSKMVSLQPDKPLEHTYCLFIGPKVRSLLQEYEFGGQTPNAAHGSLDDLYYYGWPIWFMSSVMSGILHVLYSVVGNYGVAIVLLVILVRGCMFPLSRKQAINMQKMQEKMPLIKPELEKLKEKYKGNFEQLSKAQQELYKKHGVSMMPAGGCLLIFLQLPIFSGLYRSLQLDIELRDAPLISHAVRWCSNLSAPDMLWHWEGVMPDFLASSHGPSAQLAAFPLLGGFLSHMLWLGPYFNLLPLLTIGLYFWQQKLFTPPATDEQQAMQQKLMKYMLILIALSFFTVAAGLSIYFIISSLWGICERLLLPRKQLVTPGGNLILDVSSKPTAKPVSKQPSAFGTWLANIAEKADKNGQRPGIKSKSDDPRRKKKRGK